MSHDHAVTVIRRSIGGDPAAIAWIVEGADRSDDPLVAVRRRS